jgi:hypothetical protein
VTEGQFRQQDPTEQHAIPGSGDQPVDYPGRTADMDVRPDHGEHSDQGLGRLTGKSAVITGGDSGIGRAVAIAFAREGADVYRAARQRRPGEAVKRHGRFGPGFAATDTTWPGEAGYRQS